MDGIEKIISHITSEANVQAEELLEHARHDAEEIRFSYDALAEQKHGELIVEATHEAEVFVERAKNSALLEARKSELAAKQQIISETFLAALRKLCELKEGDMLALLSTLAASSSQTGSEKLILSPGDRERYGERVLELANKKLKDAGKRAELTLSDETRSFSGGVILNSGNIDINCTFDSIIQLSREELAGDVAGILFE